MRSDDLPDEVVAPAYEAQAAQTWPRVPLVPKVRVLRAGEPIMLPHGARHVTVTIDEGLFYVCWLEPVEGA